MTVAKRELPGQRPGGRPVTAERFATARQLLDKVRTLDAARVEVRRRHVTAIEASKATVAAVFEVGPSMAARATQLSAHDVFESPRLRNRGIDTLPSIRTSTNQPDN